MKQKTINKMVKFAKLHDLRFGQLISLLLHKNGAPEDLFNISDSQLNLNFNKLMKDK